jgi:hypothetical protein
MKLYYIKVGINTDVVYGAPTDLITMHGIKNHFFYEIR